MNLNSVFYIDTISKKRPEYYSLLQAKKFKNQKYFFNQTTKLTNQLLVCPEVLNNLDYIIPVDSWIPNYMAEIISRILNIPTEKCIRKPLNYRFQKTLNRSNRILNAKKLLINCPEKIYGKNLLLLDDIITSGATVSFILSQLYPLANTVNLMAIYNLI